MATLVNTASATFPGGTGPAVPSSSTNMTGATGIYVGQNDAINASGGSAPTDNLGNTYTKTGATRAAGSFTNATIWYNENPAVSSSMVFTTTALYGIAVIAGFSGTLTSSSLDQHTSAATSGSPAASGSITPSVANELVITYFSDDSFVSDTLTTPSGYTLAITQQPVGSTLGPGSLAYLQQTTATATNPSWAYLNANAAASMVASFKTAAGGSVGTIGLDIAVAGTGRTTAASVATVALNIAVAGVGAETAASVGTVGLNIAVAGVGASTVTAIGTIGLNIAVNGVAPSIASGAGIIALNIDVAGVSLAPDLGDAHDPGLRKRRKKAEQDRQKQIADERERHERRRAQVIDAFERIVEGKTEISAPVADEIVQAIEAAAPEPITGPDFTAMLQNLNTLERLWNEHLERDDEEILVLL